MRSKKHMLKVELTEVYVDLNSLAYALDIKVTVLRDLERSDDEFPGSFLKDGRYYYSRDELIGWVRRRVLAGYTEHPHYCAQKRADGQRLDERMNIADPRMFGRLEEVEDPEGPGDTPDDEAPDASYH